MLLDARAAVDLIDDNGRLVLHHVAKKSDCRLEIVKMLLACGADPLARDRLGERTPAEVGEKPTATRRHSGNPIVIDFLCGRPVCAVRLHANS
eukprot:458790-Prymnesium_polylepis.1